MISKKLFIERVQAEVFPQLLGTEHARRRTLLIGGLWVVAGLLLLIFALNNISDMLRDEELAKAFATLITVCIVIACHVWHSFVLKQKEKFSPIFLSFLGQLENQQNVINKSLLKYTCLFPHFDYIKYDDCFSGIFENTQFSVAEIKLYVAGGKRDQCVSKGVCIDVPMKLPVSGYTLLYNKKIPQKTTVLQKITLEDVSFSKNYQIYSNNQIDARVLLTPVFMEKLNHLKRCFANKRIDVSFFGDHAVFVIRTWENLFESYSIFRKVTSVKTYEKFYDEIKAIYDMIKVLAINNKAMPKGCTFDPNLYRQISLQQAKKSNSFCLILILFFSMFIFALGTLVSSFEAGLIFSLIFLFLSVIVFLCA